MVAEAASLLEVSLPPRIDLVIHEPPVTAIVSGEPAQLQQVILNLCNNAAQAMEDAGRVEVETEVHEIVRRRRLLTHGELQPGRYVRISGQGYRPWHGRGDPGSDLRTVLHDASDRERPRARDGTRDRARAWRSDQRVEHAGRGQPFRGLAALHGRGQPAPEMDAPALPLGRGETVLMVASDRARLLRDEEIAGGARL